MGTRKKASALGTIVLVLAILAALGVGGALLYLGTRDPAVVQKFIDSKAPDGSAESFPPERVGAIVSRAKTFGRVHLGVAVLLALAFLPLRRVASDVVTGVIGMLRVSWRRTRAFFAQERAAGVALLAIMALGVGVRVAFFDMPIRGDEAANYSQFASRNIAFALSDYAHPNNHLFYTFLCHVSTKVLGGGLLGIRLPVFLAGVLLIPASFVLARAFFRKEVALGAAALVAVQPYLVFYSVCGRGYAIVALLTVLAMILAKRIVRSPGHASLALFSLCVAFGFWTIPTMLLAAGGIALWIVAEAALARPSKTWPRLIVRCASWAAFAGWVVVALYTPVFVISGVEAVTNNKFVQPFSAAEFWKELPARSGEFVRYLHTGLPAWMWSLGAAFAGLGLLLHPRVARHRMPLLVPMALWAAAIVFWKFSPPYGRVWSYAIPLYCTLIAAGVVGGLTFLVKGDRARQGAGFAVAGVAALVVAVPMLTSKGVRSLPEASLFPSPREVVLYLKEKATPEDRVLMTWPALPVVEYYAQREGLPRAMVKRPPGGPPFTMAVIDETELAAFNEKLRYQYAWMPPLVPEQMTPILRVEGGVLVRLSPAVRAE